MFLGLFVFVCVILKRSYLISFSNRDLFFLIIIYRKCCDRESGCDRMFFLGHNFVSGLLKKTLKPKTCKLLLKTL